MDKTFVGVKEIAASMGVSEKTIYRLLNDNQFPFAVKIGGQWRFRKDAVDDWISFQTRGDNGSGKINFGITLTEALQNGTVLFRIHGTNRDEVLDSLLEALPHNSGFNPENIKLSILTRESLASSCLKGISCMTVSQERPVYTEKSIIILAFLEDAADFKAMDKQPAEAVFLILAANTGEQAILETRMRRILMEERFIISLLEQPGRKDLITLINTWETKLFAGTRVK